MVNRARVKGTAAENAVESYMNYWYPDRDPEEGPVWNRRNSEGVNDGGDIFGPLTAIEVKNYRNPPISSLLDNATHKGAMSGRRYWWLVYKPHGIGETRIHMWHALMTLGEFVSRFGVTPDEDQDHLPVTDGASLVEHAPRLAVEERDVRCYLKEPAPNRTFPEHVWKPYLMFSDFRAKMEENRHRLLEHARAEKGIMFTPDSTNLHLPFVVNPRRDPSGLRPPEEWYVYSRLSGFATLLESLGVQPQMESEYEGVTPRRMLEDVESV